MLKETALLRQSFFLSIDTVFVLSSKSPQKQAKLLTVMTCQLYSRKVRAK